jgi:hypothetical protein
MKEFVAYIIKNLVDLPDEVDVNIIEGEQGTVVEVKVSPSRRRQNRRPSRAHHQGFEDDCHDRRRPRGPPRPPRSRPIMIQR